MEELSLFLVLCGTMFVGSYAAGFLPLAFTFSESKVRLLSILGAGLLVGTALSVILPEGIEALQPKVPHAIHQHHKDTHIAKQILEGNSNTANEAHPPRIVPKDAEMHANVPMDVNAHGDDNDGNARKKREKRQAAHAEFDKDTGEATNPEDHDHQEIGPTIGYSLIFGFILMLLVDQITKAKQSSRQKLTATVGLVVHAAVDGIALGSASMIDKSEIQLIVFVAIMLHKAPASFGLTTILLMEGLEKAKIKKHLFVFSASAPVGALVTYFFLPKDSLDTSSNASTTGIMLLFSAGTFLYVATVHVLPELASKRPEGHMPLPTGPSSSAHSHSQGADFTLKELIVLIIGSLLPSILASGHHH